MDQSPPPQAPTPPPPMQQPQWTPPPQQPAGWGAPSYGGPPPRPTGRDAGLIFLIVMGVLRASSVAAQLWAAAPFSQIGHRH